MLLAFTVLSSGRYTYRSSLSCENPDSRASPAEPKEPEPKVLMLDVLVSSGGLTPENTRLLLALRNSNRTGWGPKQRAISSVKTITT